MVVTLLNMVLRLDGIKFTQYYIPSALARMKPTLCKITVTLVFTLTIVNAKRYRGNPCDTIECPDGGVCKKSKNGAVCKSPRNNQGFEDTTTSSRDDRRVGAINARESVKFSHPYMASLRMLSSDGWSHKCGAVLIDENKLVTAAHCFPKDAHKHKFHIVIGAMDISDDAQGEIYRQEVGVRSWKIHEYFNKIPFMDDIATIYLNKKVQRNKNVETAPLADEGSDFENQKCILLGWGKTNPNDEYNSPLLMEAKVDQISTRYCNMLWAKTTKTIITEKQICGYDKKTKARTCDGDSGGALMCGDNFKLLAGIMSFAGANCSLQRPSVFTRVSEYLDWIADH